MAASSIAVEYVTRHPTKKGVAVCQDRAFCLATQRPALLAHVAKLNRTQGVKVRLRLRPPRQSAAATAQGARRRRRRATAAAAAAAAGVPVSPTAHHIHTCAALHSRKGQTLSCQRKTVGRQRCAYHRERGLAEAQRHGVLGCPDPVVAVRASGIAGAGRGLFAVRDLREGDLVTEYAAAPSKDSSAREYVACVQGHLVHGLTEPESGKGLGSFINSAGSGSGLVNNAELVLRDSRVYARAKAFIAAGSELLVPYGAGWWAQHRPHRPTAVDGH